MKRESDTPMLEIEKMVESWATPTAKRTVLPVWLDAKQWSVVDG